MNNEDNYIMRDSPATTDIEPWHCQMCDRQGNQSSVIFTLDPAAEICNDCWDDCNG